MKTRKLTDVLESLLIDHMTTIPNLAAFRGLLPAAVPLQTRATHQ